MSHWVMLSEGYLDWMIAHHYADTTIPRRRRHLGQFAAWCESQGLTHPANVNLGDLEAYQASLAEVRSKGRALHINTIKDYLVTLQGFFKWLSRNGVLLMNPAKDLCVSKAPNRLPRVLTETQIEATLDQADTATPEGLRDRAIMETFYATGMRVSELANLQTTDLDMGRELVWIRLGKGKKDRLVPRPNGRSIGLNAT